MHVIIIGDIVDSRQEDTARWLPILEEVLRRYSSAFDIFRGDSFQVDIEPGRAFEFVFYLKARLKAVGKLDIRVGMGIGAIAYLAREINSSNGPAFVRAGEAFDTLKKDLIALRSPWPDFDAPTNIMLEMAMQLCERWTTNMAETVAAALAHPDHNQQELTQILPRKHQSQVSTELTKGHYAVIRKVIDYCTKELKKRC